MSTTKSATVPVVLLFVFLLVGLGAIGWIQLHNAAEAAEAADYSAQAALTKEIFDQLAAMSPGQYPETLGALHLTFPDGGDQSMLERFAYTSNGTSCSILTVLGENVIEQSFP
jgi:hypothetical protein